MENFFHIWPVGERQIARADETSRRLVALYGEDPHAARGVLHAVATWCAPDAAQSTLRVIRIGPDSPKSAHDWFALRAARMRAEALLTTGKILRDEPDVQHTERDEALLAWRSERVGLMEPPRSVVLSSGRGLDLAHPLLRTAHRPLIATGLDAKTALELAAAAAAATNSGSQPPVEIAARPAPGIRDAIALLRERGCETILIEAGPSTAVALYDEPVLVDELLLSVYQAPSLATELVGPAFVSPARLDAIFAQRSDPVRIVEPSGTWSFSRFRRSS